MDMVIVMRSQISLETVKYFLVALVIAASLIFGYKAIASIGSSNCEAQLTILEEDLKESVRVQATDIGSRDKLDYDIPCDIDHIFAVDSSKKDDSGNIVVKESFYDFPEIQDALGTANLFVIKDGKVFKSFDVGDLDISYPYYECYRVRGDRLALMLEGKGRATNLKQSNPQYDCTLDRTYNAELSKDDNDDICNGIPGDCPDSDIIKLNRTIIEEPGKKTMKIEIVSEPLQEFKYWEEIPKCVAEGMITFFADATAHQYKFQEDAEGVKRLYKERSGAWLEVADGEAVFEDVDIGGTRVTLVIKKADPLMVWHFTGGSIQEEKIQYELSELQEEITSECLKQFIGTPTEVQPTAASDPDSDQVSCSDIWNADPALFLSGADEKCCGNDAGETWIPSSDPNSFRTQDVCCGSGATYVPPSGFDFCLVNDPCESFNTYFISGEQCGTVCSDKNLCVAGEICDSHEDCVSNCNLGGFPPTCN